MQTRVKREAVWQVHSSPELGQLCDSIQAAMTPLVAGVTTSERRRSFTQTCSLTVTGQATDPAKGKSGHRALALQDPDGSPESQKLPETATGSRPSNAALVSLRAASSGSPSSSLRPGTGAETPFQGDQGPFRYVSLYDSHTFLLPYVVGP